MRVRAGSGTVMLLCLCVGLFPCVTIGAYGQSRLDSLGLGDFKEKALDNIHRLNGYLEIISDKSMPPGQKVVATEEALYLFSSDTTIVEVSSVRRPGVRKIFIREYLRRLGALDYTKVQLEWAEIGFVSDFLLAPDGKYYATVSVLQRFKGYGDDNVPIYEDTTFKEIQVILEPVHIYEEQDGRIEWNLLLGHIAVTETREA